MIDPPDSPSPDSPLIRDPLTGAYARALLDDRLAEELHRARRYGERFALCVLDIDYFKSVNDAYGHLRGDQILRELVQRLLGLVRASDALFRYGGDEFVLLLPNTLRTPALALAERLLQAVRQAPFGGDPPLSLSLSVGIAHYPADGADADRLFAVADARHYEAKRQGRSRIVVAPPGQSAPPAADGDRGSAAPIPPIPADPLAAPLAALAGRGRELRQIEGLLRKSRLVTLLGPAGVGKTRLALEIGRRLRGDYAHGACFVPLAPISAPEQAAPAIAAGLGITAAPGGPLLDRLKEALAGRELLLILDHFEQIVAGAPLVTELLAAAPRLAILVTSCDVLHVYGEHVFPLPPLETPPPDSPAPGEYPAAALFAERARAASPGFALGGANAAGVGAICRLL
ncbi:MAG TPA: diguanylate cyclase, partial [Herpetosiphonaceae bacterium]